MEDFDLEASRQRLRALHAQSDARAKELADQQAEAEAWAKGILLDFGDLFAPAAAASLVYTAAVFRPLFRPWLSEMVADGAIEDHVQILRVYEKYNVQRCDLTYSPTANSDKWDRWERELEDRSEALAPPP